MKEGREGSLIMDDLRFRLNFNLSKKNEIYHHSKKERLGISNACKVFYNFSQPNSAVFSNFDNFFAEISFVIPRLKFFIKRKSSIERIT